MSALITGLPGSGKTLFTIDHIIKLTKQVGADAAAPRPVYYSGIPHLKLPWIELEDASKWTECPVGSIIIIDEAQNTFRPRAYTGAVPLHVSAIETHRHRGLDLFLITQHPTLVDKNIHRLLDRHYHLVRKFGMQWSTVHEFYEVREHPDRYRVGSVETQFGFPAEVFALYKSAELHTRKRKLPFRVKMLFIMPLIIILLSYLGYRHFVNTYSGTKPKENPDVISKPKSGSANQVGSTNSTHGGNGYNPENYLHSFVPVIPGLAFTAPVYAELTKVKQVPAPVACVATSNRCVCYTDQGTKLSEVPEPICRQIVENGFFVGWQEDRPPSQGVAGGGPERTRPAPPPASVPIPTSAVVGTVDVPPRTVLTPVTRAPSVPAAGTPAAGPASPGAAPGAAGAPPRGR